MKKIIWLLSIILTFACSQNKNTIENKREALLTKYRFSRDTFDPQKLELLTGNGEMGGLVTHDGLGFDSIWCADLWGNDKSRVPLQGVKILLDDLILNPNSIKTYSQSQSLLDGIMITDVQLKNGTAYQTKIFFSAKDRHLLVIKIKNTSHTQTLNGMIRLPESNYKYSSSWPTYSLDQTSYNRFQIKQINENEIMGVSHDTLFTSGAWHLKTDKSLKKTSKSNRFSIHVDPQKEQVFKFSFVTKWQTEDYTAASKKFIQNLGHTNKIEKGHIDAWTKDWSVTPLLILPDKKHEKLFYQSVFWLFCTSGSEHFLPGESQFAGTCWNMIPFTYGAAGWATLSFMHLGHFEKAKKMLLNHYKPQGLIENSKLYIEDPSKRKGAYSFAHEAKTNGATTTVCDEQRHLNGYALAMFHKYYLLTGDEAFLNEYLYPVAKGVAEFWSGLAIWDKNVKGYIFPKLRSVSEDLFEKSVLDIVMSAKWSLETAIHYSNKTNNDAELRTKWLKVLNQLHIPQNEKYYLEFLGDTEQREYQSYQGIRAPVYLGYPTNELTKTLDIEKSKRTLQHAWKRNHQGEGMLGFIASWYALSAQSYGLGDLALEMANQNFNCFEPSQTALCEGPHNLDRYYFLTTTASYILFPLNMLVQNYENEIIPFPAVPEAWKDIEFYNIPAENKKIVNGKLVNGSKDYFQVEKK